VRGVDVQVGSAGGATAGGQLTQGGERLASRHIHKCEVRIKKYKMKKNYSFIGI
jgi:hypothetical protein